MTDEQNCIYDMFMLLRDVSEKADKRDLALVRPRSTIGAGMYLGRPLIVKLTDELFEKYEGQIRGAIRAKEELAIKEKEII